MASEKQNIILCRRLRHNRITVVRRIGGLIGGRFGWEWRGRLANIARSEDYDAREFTANVRARSVFVRRCGRMSCRRRFVMDW